MTAPEPYYQDDFVTIYHGDCYEITPTIEGVDALITDPPYGISLDTRFSGRGKQPGKDYPRISGDDAQFDPTPFLSYGVVVMFGANYFSHLLPPSGAWIVWDRLDGLWGKREQGFSNVTDCELAWTNGAGSIRMYRHRWNGFQRDGEDATAVHPTQKPVALMRWLVEKYTKPGDLILDPFMGSGPIARAAKDLGRRYVGIEIEQQYVDAAVARCRQEVLL